MRSRYIAGIWAAVTCKGVSSFGSINTIAMHHCNHIA